MVEKYAQRKKVHLKKQHIVKNKWEDGSKTNFDCIHLYCGFVSAQAVC